MKTIDDYLEAIKHLYLFKTYTTFPRFVEILLGINAWCSLILFLTGIVLIFIN